MTDREVIEIFGKSIWEMTPEELITNDLDIVWFNMVEAKEMRYDE